MKCSDKYNYTLCVYIAYSYVYYYVLIILSALTCDLNCFHC